MPGRLGGHEGELVEAIGQAARPLEGSLGDYDRLLDAIGDARYVLIGEASHGTDEFYRERALITRRLIVEKGFAAVVVEADWPDAYRANRYTRGISSDATADRALSGFARFPTWMWRNRPVVEFVDWLRDYNDTFHEAWSAVGFYGLDLYSLYTSVDEVVAYLEAVDPAAAERARERYACLGVAGRHEHRYGIGAAHAIDDECEKEVVEQLLELMESRSTYAAEDEVLAEDEFFFAEQNARLARNAEAYYRTLYRGGVSSWNLRDLHMMETLEALVAHLSTRIDDVRVVVWAHNSHLGDARHTSMGRTGEWNLGQLVREAHPEETFLLGLTTWSGEVTAAAEWDAPAETMRVRPALPGSVEDLFHRVGIPRFELPLRGVRGVLAALNEERFQRMIGVVYRPSTERWSHYFECAIGRQFDAVIHLDQTRAVEPLEREAPLPSEELAETYPSAL